MDFKEIAVNDFEIKIIDKIAHEWYLVTALKDGKANALTASWGQMGHLWNKPVATVYVRPSRYTREFIDGSDFFTISYLQPGHKKALSYIGSVSGRDVPDKVTKMGLHPILLDGQPTYEEASLVIICRKIYAQQLKQSSFLDNKIDAAAYPRDDYSISYVGEIVKIYRQ